MRNICINNCSHMPWIIRNIVVNTLPNTTIRRSLNDRKVVCHQNASIRLSFRILSLMKVYSIPILWFYTEIIIPHIVTFLYLQRHKEMCHNVIKHQHWNGYIVWVFIYKLFNEGLFNTYYYSSWYWTSSIINAINDIRFCWLIC